MTLKIVHDYLQATQNGYLLNVYLSRGSQVEFAEELGRLKNPQADAVIFDHIKHNYPRTPISQVRVIAGDGQIHRLSYMSIQADVKPQA